MKQKTKLNALNEKSHSLLISILKLLDDADGFLFIVGGDDMGEEEDGEGDDDDEGDEIRPK